jgi:mannosyltransferase
VRVARRQLRSWAIATAAALVAAAPIIVLGASERHQIAFLAHHDVITPQAILVSMWFWSTPVAVVAWALVLAAAIGWVVDVRAALHRASGVRDVEGAPPLETLALSWLIVPVGVLLLTSIVSPGFTARYGTFAAPAAAILVALGLRRLLRAGRRAGVRDAWIAGIAGAALVFTIVPAWASQRGPYAKNQSDWNEIAATVSASATPGDAIVFDEGARPSRRTRLAMDTAPAAFTAVRDVTLKTAYPDASSWHDTAYTVSEAAARGRFAGVARVWLVEYAAGGLTDTWGVTDLRALGFHRTRTVDLHRSVVALYER